MDHPTQNTLGSPPGHFKPPSLHGQHCQTKTRKVLEHGHFLRVFGRGLYWTMFPCWVCVECFSMGQKGKNGSPLHPREVPDLQKIWIRCQVSRQGNICGLVIPQAVHSWRSTRSTRSAAKNLQHFPGHQVINGATPIFGNLHDGWLGHRIIFNSPIRLSTHDTNEEK